ncbi:MAG: hypothetical protein ACI4TX_05160, partial [Christensenellales bacterium]
NVEDVVLEDADTVEVATNDVDAESDVQLSLNDIVGDGSVDTDFNSLTDENDVSGEVETLNIEDDVIYNEMFENEAVSEDQISFDDLQEEVANSINDEEMSELDVNFEDDDEDKKD